MARALRIGITIGDPGGIGAEVALRALVATLEEQRLSDPEPDEPKPQFCLIGPESLWADHANALQRTNPDLRRPIDDALDRTELIHSDDPFDGAPALIGQTSGRHGSVARLAVERAVALCMDDELDAIVTAPLSKEGLRASGSPFPGHTEMLQSLTGSPDVGMLLVGGGLRVGLVTIHVPLRQVFELLSIELIVRKAALLNDFLKSWLGEGVAIAVCGLNPHAGEGGLFGDEEARIIAPAIAECRRQGMLTDGPHPPDTVFYHAMAGNYDAILALYHDQGLIAVKTLAFDSGVNVTMGLPIIRTSPDHGTAFGIAGRGIASPGSMKAAMETAIDLARARSRRP